jgi:O-antigen ligase
VALRRPNTLLDATQLQTIVVAASLTLSALPWLPGPSPVADQFALPKEVCAGAAGMALALLWAVTSRHREIPATVIATIMILASMVVAVTTTAVNPYWSWRTIGAVAFGLIVFECVAAFPSDEARQAVLRVVLLIAVMIGGAVICEAFGLVPFFSEPGRRPGAMLGNRNAAARAACLALPIAWWIASKGGGVRRVGMLICFFILLMTVALSRSRAAWLVAAASVILLPLVEALRDGRSRDLVTRTLQHAVTVVAVVVLVALVPNAMDWSSEDFMDSGRRAFDMTGGSGRARLVQLQSALWLVQEHPLFGVGPGNWFASFPTYQRSVGLSPFRVGLDAASRYPQADVTALISETGALGVALVGFWCACLLTRNRPRTSKADADSLFYERGPVSVLLLSVIAFALVERVVRDVALIGCTAATLGAWTRPDLRLQAGAVTRYLRTSVAGLWIVICGAACSAASRELYVRVTLLQMTELADLKQAASLAPNSLEARVYMAYLFSRAKRCDLAREHLVAIERLNAESPALASLKRVCRETD